MAKDKKEHLSPVLPNKANSTSYPANSDWIFDGKCRCGISVACSRCINIYEQGKSDGIKEESHRHSGVRREWFIRGHNDGVKQCKKEALVLMQKALGNCYCGKYAKCPVVEKIKRLSK